MRSGSLGSVLSFLDSVAEIRPAASKDALACVLLVLPSSQSRVKSRREGVVKAGEGAITLSPQLFIPLVGKNLPVAVQICSVSLDIRYNSGGAGVVAWLEEMKVEGWGLTEVGLLRLAVYLDGIWAETHVLPVRLNEALCVLARLQESLLEVISPCCKL